MIGLGIRAVFVSLQLLRDLISLLFGFTKSSRLPVHAVLYQHYPLARMLVSTDDTLSRRCPPPNASCLNGFSGPSHRPDSLFSGLTPLSTSIRCLYQLDRATASVMGRPVCLHDEECALIFPPLPVCSVVSDVVSVAGSLYSHDIDYPRVDLPLALSASLLRTAKG